MKANGHESVTAESAMKNVIDRGRFNLTIEPGDPPVAEIVRELQGIAARLGVAVDTRRSSRSIAIRLVRSVLAPRAGRPRAERHAALQAGADDRPPNGERAAPTAADIRRAMNTPPAL